MAELDLERAKLLKAVENASDAFRLAHVRLLTAQKDLFDYDCMRAREVLYGQKL